LLHLYLSYDTRSLAGRRLQLMSRKWGFGNEAINLFRVDVYLLLTDLNCQTRTTCLLYSNM